MAKASFLNNTQRCRVPAPAKLNFFLHVIGRRADGYHLLESVFALIDFSDTITLTCREDGRIVREHDWPGVSEEDDLSLRAARLLQETSKTPLGVCIKVEKRIPMGSGLGGGSSNAASVLLALNRLWKLHLPKQNLLLLAQRLGADVPFFIGGSAAFVSGVGEVLCPMTMPAMWIALALPPINVCTAAVFSAPNLTRDATSERIPFFTKEYGRNDLEPIVTARYFEVSEALSILQKKTSVARMSGSGSTVFGVFDDVFSAEQAVEALPKRFSPRLTRTVMRHPLAAWSFREKKS